MFYEKLNIQVDIDLLRKHVAQYVFPVGDAIFQGDEYGYDNFGGWSLLSRTGDWREGWEVSAFHGHPAEQLLTINGQPNYPVHKFLNLSHSFEHATPTQACQGYIQQVIDRISDLGFWPRRARVSLLRPGGATVMHSDAAEDVYMARIHIPLWTNEQCTHTCDGYPLHMPADGSVYMLWVNRAHQVHNRSDQNRYHMIMDAYDTQHQTQNFGYPKDIGIMQAQAQQYRAHMDGVQLTTDQIQYFEHIRQQYINT